MNEKRSLIDVNSAIAGEIMTPRVIRLEYNAVFRDIISIMHQNRISAVFIHDKPNDKYFIVSQTDIVNFLNDGGMFKDNIAAIPISKIMKGPVKMLDFNTPIDKIIRFMAKHKYKRILISRDGKAVGVVSTRDIMKWNDTYFKPAKPQVLLIMDNSSNNFIARHIFDEHVQDKIQNDLIDIYGGAIRAISLITDEIINKSGKMYNIIKDKRSVLFEPYRNITGILICDYNSIELRRKLQNAIKIFYDTHEDVRIAEKEKRGIHTICNLDSVLQLFKDE